MNRINFLYNINRKTDYHTLISYFKSSLQENFLDTIILVFHLRDCVNPIGKGERDKGRLLFEYLALNYPNEFKRFIEFIPRYGRYDDWFVLFPGKIDLNTPENYLTDNLDKTTVQQLQQYTLSLFVERLKLDLQNYKRGSNISLCAKWAPSEKCKWDTEYGLVKTITEFWGIPRSTYRRKYLVPLRYRLNILENNMRARNWRKVDLEEVTSRAINKYKKSLSLNIPRKYKKYIRNIEKNYRVNLAKIIRNYELDGIVNRDRELEFSRYKNTLNPSNDVCVIDVSGSMYNNNKKYLSSALSIAITAMMSCRNTKYKNKVINFYDKPTLHTIENDELLYMLQSLTSLPTTKNTSLISIVDAVQDSLPERIVIVTDMDIANSIPNWRIEIDILTSRFLDKGVQLPQIIYMCVFHPIVDVIEYKNMRVISGYFDRVIDPMEYLNSVVYNECYLQLREVGGWSGKQQDNITNITGDDRNMTSGPKGMFVI